MDVLAAGVRAITYSTVPTSTILSKHNHLPQIVREEGKVIHITHHRKSITQA